MGLFAFRLPGLCSATVFAESCRLPSLEELKELPSPVIEVTTSNSAAKTASLSEIRDLRCLVNLNIIVSRVKFSVLVIG